MTLTRRVFIIETRACLYAKVHISVNSVNKSTTMTDEKEVSVENNGKQNGQENKLEEPTELESSIIRQVEYYFGDLNLPRDKFLREQINLDEGWVPLDVLISFNRLAKLTTDLGAIANALNKSSSGLLEVSEDLKKVRRSPEVPLPEMNEERRKELLSRSIYAKGFPKDITLDELLTYFKQFEEVENVVMRRYLNRQTKERPFKGSVFATFKTKEQAEKFLGNTGLKYKDTDLLVLWQEAYVQKKQEEYAARKEKKEKTKNERETREEKDDIKLPTGTVLYFSEGHDKMTREDVKAELGKLGAEIAYIDFKVGDKEGWVRLTKENAAKEVNEKIADGKIKIGESEVVFKLLEGDEEKTYLERTIEEMTKRRRNQKNFSKNKGKNFKGRGNRKRRQDQSRDGPPAKVRANAGADDS